MKKAFNLHRDTETYSGVLQICNTCGGEPPFHGNYFLQKNYSLNLYFPTMDYP